MRLRRSTQLIILSAAFFGLLGVAFPGTAQACSCSGEKITEYADDVAIAFSGRQVDRVVFDEMQDNGTSLFFEVDEVFKGEAGPIIEVTTHAQGGACGIDMANAGRTGVAVFEWQGQLNVGLCGSVVPLDLLPAAFGEGSPPDEAIVVELPGAVDAPDEVEESSSADNATLTSGGSFGASELIVLGAVALLALTFVVAVLAVLAAIQHRRQ